MVVYWVLPSFTEFLRPFVRSTGFNRVLTGFEWVSLECGLDLTGIQSNLIRFRASAGYVFRFE